MFHGMTIRRFFYLVTDDGGAAARLSLANAIEDAEKANARGKGAWIMDEAGGRLWPNPGPRVTRAEYLHRKMIGASGKPWDAAPSAYAKAAAGLAITSPFIVPAGGDYRASFRAAYGYVRDTFEFPEVAEIYPC